MNLKLTISPDAVREIIPANDVLAEAVAAGMEVGVRRHLRRKNSSTRPNKYGLPKSNYYAEVADTVRGSHTGGKATVEIGPDNEKGPGNGIALHFYGGTVYPKKKALAIPIDPLVAGIWPSEAPDNLSMIWPKGSSHGFLKDSGTSALLYLLVPKVTIRADQTVLPSGDEIVSYAESAIMSLLEAS